MAWTSADLASYESTKFAADKPLIAVNAIPLAPTTVKWVNAGDVGAGNIVTWTDRTDATYPALRAYDGQVGLYTTTSSATSTAWYLAFDMGSTIEFDCAFVVNHNFYTKAATGAVVQIADDNAFSTNLTTVADFGAPASDARLQVLTLLNSKRYTAQYIWLKISKGAAYTGPYVGELILGRRRQLEFAPQRPFDNYGWHDEFEINRTIGGVIDKLINYERQRKLSAKFILTDSTYLSDRRAFWRASRGSFVWVRNPYSAPALFNVMSLTDEVHGNTGDRGEPVGNQTIR